MTGYVSVILPVRNGMPYLRDALESLLRQSQPVAEIIVMEDGPDDATREYLASTAKADLRVRVHRNPQAGLVSALNAAIRLSTRSLIARMDADDISLPTRMEKQAKFLREHPDHVLVGTRALTIDHAGREIGTMNPPGRHSNIMRRFEIGNPFIHPSVMFRREAVLGIGGYRNAFPAAEDYDLWLRLSAVGKLANLTEHLVKYRVHDKGTSTLSIEQSAASAIFAQYCHAERSEGRTDPSLGAMTAPPADLVRSLGQRWRKIYQIYLLHLMSGRQSDPSGISRSGQIVSKIYADKRADADLRMRALYSLLHVPSLLSVPLLGAVTSPLFSVRAMKYVFEQRYRS
jgi:GT2 family glycosyltransferase